MKNRPCLKLFLLSVLLFPGFILRAQTDPIEADIIKMQQINGSHGTNDAIFGQIVAQLKASKPEVTDEKLAALK